MSKGSLFFGNARGKLGETVFYRAGGEQRNRTYIKEVRNPKTVAQMTQRILTLNPISMFKNMKQVIQQSFTERKVNQSSYNKFVQENSSAKKFFITKAMLDGNMCVPFGAIISKGAMGVSLEPTLMTYGNGGSTMGLAVFDCAFDAKKLTDFSGLSGTGAIELTSENLVRVLRETSVVELPSKFSVTFVQAVPQEYELENGEIVEPWKLAYKIISVDGDTYTEKVYGCSGSALNSSLVVIPTISNAPLAAANPATHIAVDLGVNAVEDVIKRPMGIILAFEQDGKLIVSDSTITGNYKNVGVTPVRGVVSAFLEGNAVYREAMNQYGYSMGSALNSTSLAVGTCYIEFTGDTEDLLVNGKAAVSGGFKVGDTLVFSNNSTESIVIELDGETIAADVALTRTASWVVPQAAAITLVCEQEEP